MNRVRNHSGSSTNSMESGNLSTLVPVLVLTTLVLLLMGCGRGSSESDIEATVEAKVAVALTAVPTSTPTPTPTATPRPTSTPTPMSTATSTPTPVPTLPSLVQDTSVAVEIDQQQSRQAEQHEVFWNEPLWPVTQKCTGSFQFAHKLVDVADVDSIGVGPGSHIAPHGHMAYWMTPAMENEIVAPGEKQQLSEKVQLYSPTDILYIDVWEHNKTSEGAENVITYKEWGGYLYTCDGHQIVMGHITEPSNEVNLLLSENESECDEHSCRWRFSTFIPAGTALFKSSGFTSGFDFGLMLVGLTVEELQKQPGYGYSITPWRTPSGNAVCPPEYFEEPLRSEYMKLLGDFKCGPFNQDVPETAMGFWFPSPSPEIIPSTPFERDVDEWETIWLYQDFRDSSEYIITVGNNTFGLDYGAHSYIFSGTGLVNQKWDEMDSGQTYCTELKVKENMFVVAEDVHKILILKVSGDDKQLTVEALDSNQCGDGPWTFQEGERTFYR